VRADVIQVPLGFADLDFAQANLGVKTTHSNKKSNQQSLVFGFVGQIGNRFDFNWLLSLIQAFPRHKFEFVGSVWSWKELDDNEMNQKIDILKSQPNCIFKPPVPKSEIPAVIAHFDFGLIPYDTTQVFNKNCHPLKLYEYWYFGKPVIATAITELKKSQNVLIASDKIVEVIAWTQATITKGYPDSKRKLSQRKAAANSWQAKIQEISELIEKGGSS
jgi:teichuronic acid biosynthesis glycosyltransferase TuaH